RRYIMPWHRLIGLSVAMMIPAVSYSASPIVHGLRFAIERVEVAGDLQVLHVVGGAEAARDGLPAGTDRWYIGRDADGPERFARIIGTRAVVVSPARVEDAAPAPVELAIHPRINPGPSSLVIGCDLPGRDAAKLELFDVMGRRLASREMAAGAPGRV